MAKLTIENIKKFRAKLPAKWKWSKCYEMGRVDYGSYKHYTVKHWALVAIPDDQKVVCSLKTISINHWDSREQFVQDHAACFVENSLEMVDFLLAEIERLKAPQTEIFNTTNHG